MHKILVVDDDRDMRSVLAKYLQKNDYQVIEATNGKSALEILETTEPDVILCDFRLGDTDGITLLGKIKQKHAPIPFVFITGYGDIKIAVEVMKMGAFDYVTKPLLPEEILLTIKKALAKKESKTSFARVPDEKSQRVQAAPVHQYIFGSTPVFTSLLEQVILVAPTNFSVIIYGETGSGKEGIALEIHKRSKRKSKPFVAIDCGVLSKELANSELFGHEKGAFTGALYAKTGSFELANGGTLFLDEIGNLPYDVQVSLLRVVQERKMRKVGGILDIELDVRIIIASNERLWDAQQKNSHKFREDLFHRFNEFTINVPPLRERKDDIKIFADHFLQATNAELEKNITGFTSEVENIFLNYAWYGNLRELKNVIKRAALLTKGTVISVEALPPGICQFPAMEAEEKTYTLNSSDDQSAMLIDPRVEEVQETLKEAGIDAEYELILSVLKKVKFNKTKTAKILKIDRKTLYNKLDQYQLLNEK